MHLKEVFSCCYLIKSWSFLCFQKMIYFCHLKCIKSLKNSRSPACPYVPSCPTGQLGRFEVGVQSPELSSDSNSVIDNCDFTEPVIIWAHVSLLQKKAVETLLTFTLHFKCSINLLFSKKKYGKCSHCVKHIKVAFKKRSYFTNL